MESAAHLCWVPTWLILEVAIIVEDDAHWGVMALLEEDQTILEQIVTLTEGLFKKKMMVPEPTGQQEDESLTHFAVALQNLWKQQEQRDAHGCAIITNSKLLPRDQFMEGLESGPVRRALQKRIRAQPTISFLDVVMEVFAREQDVKATVTVTNSYDYT